ncbi:MAG: exonuclease domain-containing protein [Candidatus Acetothermia bacterium]|jgi:predicted DnaQ family exonuclease/DinG family helicase|nr:exonuclease domain-containing protein [Candidatus Acetothermia bacterium]MDH7505185.1 helicase C-terminal domain-containing protein [Candidatus Acetothermia bacterium]
MRLDPELLRRLGLSQFTALDLETTGLDPETAEIIECGTVQFIDGEPGERFSSLVCPAAEAPPQIVKLTGIDADELRRAPSLAAVLPLLLQSIRGRVVAHNAEFERSFLQAGAARLGIALPPYDWLDTLILARALFPRLHNHKLGTLAGELGFPSKELHRAAADAERVGFVLLGLLRRGLEISPTALEALLLLAPTALRQLFQGLLEYRQKSGPRAQPRSPRGPASSRSSREPHEEFRLDCDEIAKFFEEDGPLAARLTSFRARPGQIAMARDVAQAFNDSAFLIAEAGTGTGKSFAYLVPAILWARGRGERVIVSTNTKNLQDQLFGKDLPLLGEALGDFRAVLLKGRGNYLCQHKWESLLLERAGQLGLELEEEFLTIPVWLEETVTGDLTENGGFWRGQRASALATRLTDDPDYCLGRACPFQESCFSLTARRAAREADVVVINHALLIADLDSEQELLGEYRYLIVDEAHNLEVAATDQLTQRLSFWDLMSLPDELQQERGLRAQGLLPLLSARIAAGRFDPQLKEELRQEIEQAGALVAELRRRGRALFASLTEILREQQGLTEESYPLEHSLKDRYDHQLFAQLAEELGELRLALMLLAGSLEKVEALLQGLREGVLSDQPGLMRRLAAAWAGTERLRALLDFMAEASDENTVFWFELPQEVDRFAALYASPLEVAGLLHEKLFQNLEAAVFTSATLAVAGDFRYLAGRLGLDRLPPERLRARSFGEPFEYEKRSRLAVPEFLPAPDDPEFQPMLAQLILDLSRRVGRRMMVLFTSHRALSQVYWKLRAAGESELYAQGIEGSRLQVMEGFRHSSTKRATLLGTSSFWEGVDLPGEDLEILVLTRLPFSVPTEPVVAARAERIASAGGNPFQEYFLPQAVLRLRQGFGRLIRTENDRGVVIIADKRIVHQAYGRSFRESLPLRLVTYYTPSRLLVELEEFFTREGHNL